MPEGLAKILTNACFDGWVKISMAELNCIERKLYFLGILMNEIPTAYVGYVKYGRVSARFY